MQDFLRLSAERRALLFEQAQQILGLAPASIEKDFWVCWILRELFSLPEWGTQFAFKGGTSLSKAWKIIQRFSEDVDVVIDRQFLGFGGELSRNRQKKLVQACSERIRTEVQPRLEGKLKETLPSDLPFSLKMASVEEDSDQQTLLFQYPSTFAQNVSYLRPVVKIEMGARGETEPAETRLISPYLAEAYPDIIGPGSFTVRTISPRRTFWEKAMLLHEETYRPAGKVRRARLARHYYDIWCLIQCGVATAAVDDEGLFERIAAHRELFFGYNWLDYSTLRKGCLRLTPLPDQLLGWKQDYEAMRGEMFMTEPPPFEVLLEAAAQFESDFNHSK